VIEHAHPKEVRQELAYTNFGDGITKARLQELWTFNLHKHKNQYIVLAHKSSSKCPWQPPKPSMELVRKKFNQREMLPRYISYKNSSQFKAYHNCWRNTQSQRDDGDVGTHVCAVHPSLQNTPCNKLSWPTNYLRNYRITSLAIPFMSPPKNKKKDNKEKKITTNWSATTVTGILHAWTSKILAAKHCPSLL
jgi:hypothetical protein